MKKTKNIISLILIGILVFITGIVFSNMDNKTKEPAEESPKTESVVEQTYSAVIDGNVSPVSSGIVDYEKYVVSVKLTNSGKAFLIHELTVYEGEYTIDAENEKNIELVLSSPESVTHVVNMTVGDNNCVELADDKASAELFGDKMVSLSKVQDSGFMNGLYRGLGSYVAGNYRTQIEAGVYTYKVDDKHIYTCDISTGSYEVNIEMMGNQFVYTYYADRNHEVMERNLFFIENQGEHDMNFVSTFGDLDNVIYYVEDETSGLNRYYSSKVDTGACALQITEQTLFNATKFYKENFETSECTYDESEISATLNIDGTATFSVANSNSINGTFNGRWYNIEQGFLIILEQTTIFGNVFTIGANGYVDGLTIDMLKENALTDVYLSESVECYVAWSVSSIEEVENWNEWIAE